MLIATRKAFASFLLMFVVFLPGHFATLAKISKSLINGEEAREVLVGKVTKANPGIVTCLNDEKHGFEDDDTVTFREVQGMTQLNESQHKIKGKIFPIIVF